MVREIALDVTEASKMVETLEKEKHKLREGKKTNQ